MMSNKRILAIVDRALEGVDALEGLAACMSAGLREEVLEPRQLYTLLSTQAAAIREHLQQLAREVDQDGDIHD